jgi:DNA invertase Pin-like site-specific DNA recombinase
MAQSSRRPRAAVYCRISDDREGERLGVERQREDCLARAQREGWEVVDVFTDNDVGASTRSRKPRPAYRQMIKAAENGEIDVILSYSNSRLTRRPLELEHLINLHNSTGVLLRTIVSGDADLSTADGRAVARTIAAWDAAEAERIGERVARAARQRREQGLRHGGFPPYGYLNAPGGRLAIHPDRAAVVREAAGRILSGESLYGVWTDLNRRGILTAPSPRAPHGARWQAQTLKRVLTAPATIGCVQSDTGELREVSAPILDRKSWQRLREALYDDQRFDQTRKPDWSNRRKYALSGLLTCSLCGHWLSGSTRAPSRTNGGRTRPKVQTFSCQPANGGCGKLRIDYAPVEAWVLGQVFARLDVPSLRDALAAGGPQVDDDELRQQIQEDERLLERLDDDHADGLLDRHRYVRQLNRIQQRLHAARRKLAEVRRANFVIDTGGRTVRDVWCDRDIPWQRTLLKHVIDKIVIEPHPAGVTTNLSRRRAETDEDVAQRRAQHRERLLLQRVHISWKA